MLRIDESLSKDDNVILGYISGRLKRRLPLEIRKNARLRSGTIIYEGTVIGDNFETGHNVIIREENHIGDNVNVWSNTIIDYGCRIGSNVLIHSNVYIAQFTVIEDNVFLAPGVTIANDKYPIDKNNLIGPTICSGARIGVNSTILPNIRIGRNALIGAGSVVTRDVPDGKIVYGVPARIIE